MTFRAFLIKNSITFRYRELTEEPALFQLTGGGEGSSWLSLRNIPPNTACLAYSARPCELYAATYGHPRADPQHLRERP